MCSSDLPVQMFIVLPPDHVEGRRYPLVHMIHGGPHGSFGDMWHARWNAQAFAAPGHVVALVNFQGSTGWGQRFAQCIQGEWAARPYEDILRATDALIAAGVARVVVAVEDPDPQVAGRGVARLRAAGIEVEVGVRADAAAASLAPYLHQRRTGRAFALLKTAASLDGRTAAADGTSQWITGPDRKSTRLNSSH